MADTFPAGVLADLRHLVTVSMPDTATNGRTGALTPAYIHTDPKLLTVERGFRVRSYQIDIPVETDYEAGDTLTLGSDQGVFAVEQTLLPVSYPAFLQLVCVPTSLRLASYLAVESAVFRHPTLPAQSVTAPIFVVDQMADVQEYGATPGYRWMVVFESSLRYPSAPTGDDQIGDGHQLRLASLFGTDARGNARSGPISKPRPVLHALPFMAAYVKELAG